MRTAPFSKELPEYLHAYIVKQDPSLYTPMDHASWRYIMKLARSYFSVHAHEKYLDGLKETGISADRIPLIEEMDERLSRFGWHAVAVSGFIPPAIFMEFLSRGIMPIACDMRKIEHIAYTPAPDIVHEAAGHAPIVADPDYARYLHSYGELAEKVIFSAQDLDVYEAVRNLSDIKEDPSSTPSQIAEAQKRLDEASAAVDHVSEATQLARMGWWTIEYGLVGDLSNPKIYGAGLLSSVGESFHCLGPNVKKIPFSVDCVNMTYDITKPQPQLYVARDFQELRDGLEEFAKTLAFRKGGIEGLAKAKKARTPTTAVLDSGLQISGVISDFLTGADGSPVYLRTQGPTQLSTQDTQIDGHSPTYHASGFGTPVGMIQGFHKSPTELTTSDLSSLGFKSKSKGKLVFESGVRVEGVLIGTYAENGKNLVLSFKDCRVTLGNETLFQPEWGTFDMACGTRVVSVFGGAADKRKYFEATGGFKQPPGKPKTNLTLENRALNELYARVREIRESGELTRSEARRAELSEIQMQLEKDHPQDWLLRYELLELSISQKLQLPWEELMKARLNEIASQAPKEIQETIQRGLRLL